MPTIDTYWDINGVSLNEAGYNVVTWGGDLQAPPPLRGSDFTIPYRPGDVLQKRRPSGRTLSFSMWAVGAGATTGANSFNMGKSPRDLFREQFNFLRKLMWNQGNPVSITKRWRDSGGILRTATAVGVYAGGLSPNMTGNSRATFTVEFYLADPFFYGNAEVITFDAVASSVKTVTVLGDYETTSLHINVPGPRNNFRMTNNTEALYVNVDQNLTSSTAPIVLDVNAWTAIKGGGTGSDVNVVGSVTNFGHEFWFALRPGTQKLTLSSSTGTSSGTIVYKPRYI